MHIIYIYTVYFSWTYTTRNMNMGFSETSCIPKLTGAAPVHPPSRPRVLRDMAWRNNITESFSVRIFFRPESVWKSWNNWFFLGVLIGLQELFNIETNWFLVVGWHSYTAVAGIICKPFKPCGLTEQVEVFEFILKGEAATTTILIEPSVGYASFIRYPF